MEDGIRRQRRDAERRAKEESGHGKETRVEEPYFNKQMETRRSGCVSTGFAVTSSEMKGTFQLDMVKLHTFYQATLIPAQPPLIKIHLHLV